MFSIRLPWPWRPATSSRSTTCVVRGLLALYRIWSTTTRRAIDNSQVLAVDRPLNRGSDRMARTKVSWVRSSALPGSAR